MYLERPQRRAASLVRIIVLIGLIGAGAIILSRSGEGNKPATPTPAATRTATSYIADAEAATRAGRLDDAILAYRVALTLEPDNPAIAPPLVRLMIYQSQGRKERLTEALRLAQRAARITPESAPVQAALALALDWNGETLEAIYAGRAAIQLDPNYAEGYAFLAEAYADGKNWLRAMDAAETARKLNPNSIDAHRANGYVLESQGRYGEALAHYQRALELAPNVAFLYHTIARTYSNLGNYDAAIKQYERALELEPGRADTQDEMGWTYYQRYILYGRSIDLESSIKELSQATENNPEYAPAWAHLGFAYYRRRDYENTITALGKAIELGGDKIENYYTLGLAHFYMDQCNLAMPLFQKALSMDPNDPNAHGGINLCLGVTATPLPPTPRPRPTSTPRPTPAP